MKDTGIPATLSIRKTTTLTTIQSFKRGGQSVVRDELAKIHQTLGFVDYIP
jgi:hypothetical protein